MEWNGVTDPKLLALMKQAVAKFNAMSPAEVEAMCREHARRVAEAEAAWDEDTTIEVRP